MLIYTNYYSNWQENIKWLDMDKQWRPLSEGNDYHSVCSIPNYAFPKIDKACKGPRTQLPRHLLFPCWTYSSMTCTIFFLESTTTIPMCCYGLETQCVLRWWCTTVISMVMCFSKLSIWMVCVKSTDGVLTVKKMMAVLSWQSTATNWDLYMSKDLRSTPPKELPLVLQNKISNN
jgi:hypothetical protein